MAVEEKRGCGYRKVGGLYLVGSGAGFSCGKLPLNLHVCPTCSGGIKYARGFTWIEPRKLFETPEGGSTCGENTIPCRYCAVGNPPEGKHALLWIGKKFYSPEEFLTEAKTQGISKRIPALPRDFKLGETWCYIAHLEAGEERVAANDGVWSAEQNSFIVPESKEVPKEHWGTKIISEEYFYVKKSPAIFYAFKPTAVEKIVTETDAKDEQEMESLRKRGITPIIVPDDDKDHMGTVHDKKAEE